MFRTGDMLPFYRLRAVLFRLLVYTIENSVLYLRQRQQGNDMQTRLSQAIEKKAQLEKHLSSVAGYAVEITVRGAKAFTLSFDALDTEAAKRLAAAALGMTKGYSSSVVADSEIEATFVYLDAA